MTPEQLSEVMREVRDYHKPPRQGRRILYIDAHYHAVSGFFTLKFSMGIEGNGLVGFTSNDKPATYDLFADVMKWLVEGRSPHKMRACWGRSFHKERKPKAE